MRNTRMPTCPGCHRHCPMNAPCCGHGRAYFARMQQAETQAAESAISLNTAPSGRERSLARGGLASRLISVSRSAKMAIQHQQMPEEEFFASLTADERKTLLRLLKKLDYRGSLVG